MMLTFGAPLFLWMLPLAGLPVLFHLFLKVRKRSRRFPSLRFFVKADPRLSARRKIREWLALLLRILLIAFLLLALSRPLWLGSRGGGSVAQVLILDNSASMAGMGMEERSKLAHMLDGAHSLVSGMDNSATAALVLLAPDPVAALPEGLTGNRDILRAALNSITPTHGSGQPAAAMDKAVSLLKNSTAAHREVHVISDLQETEWLTTSPRADDAPANITWVFHRIPTPPAIEADVAVTSVELPPRRLVASRPFPCTVRLRNTSGKHVAHLKVQSQDSSGKSGSRDVTVSERTTRTVTMNVEPQHAGIGWLKIGIDHDGLETDNDAYVPFTVTAPRAVVFVGAPGAFGFLPDAVAPAGDGTLSGLAPRFQETTSTFADDVVMAVTSSSQLGSSAPELESFVRGGGILLVIADTSEAGADTPAWLGAKPEGELADSRGIVVLPLNHRDGFWDDLRDDDGAVYMRDVRVFRFHPLELVDDATALLGLADGRPILARRRIGKGTAFTSGLAFQPDASTLPLRAAFLAIVQGMALEKTGIRDSSVMIAGTTPEVKGGADTPVTIRSVVGSALTWEGSASEMPAIPRCGIYVVTSGSNMKTVGVRPAPEEGEASFVAADAVPGCEGLPHRVVNFKNPDIMIKTVRRLRSGRDLFLLLAALALLAAVLETWVVNPTARRGETRPFGSAYRRRKEGDR